MAQLSLADDPHGVSILEAGNVVVYHGRPMQNLEREEAELLKKSIEDADPSEWSTDESAIDIDLTPPS